MLYIVLDDDETWSTEAFIIFEEVLNDEEKERISESDSKVFKNPNIPRISVCKLIETLKRTGLWPELVKKLHHAGYRKDVEQC